MTRARMAHGIVDCLLHDAEQCDGDIRLERVDRPVAAVVEPPRKAAPRLADRAVEVVFHRIGKAEQMQHRWLGLFDDLAQRLHGEVQRPAQIGHIRPRDLFARRKPVDPPREAGEVGERLVVQVHPDALAFLLERLCQPQRALPQPLLARAGLGLDDGRLAGLFGGAQGKEIGRQQFRHIARVAQVVGPVTCGRGQRTAQCADDLAMHDHRHMQPRAQAMVKDRRVKGAFKAEPQVRHRVVGQDIVNLAHQQRTDRAVDHRTQRKLPPGGVDPGLIGGMEPPVALHDAHVEVVMRHDRRDLGRDRADRRAEVELPGKQPRDAEELLEPRRGGIRGIARPDHDAPPPGDGPIMAQLCGRRHGAIGARLAGTRNAAGQHPQTACLFAPRQGGRACVILGRRRASRSPSGSWRPPPAGPTTSAPRRGPSGRER